MAISQLKVTIQKSTNFVRPVVVGMIHVPALPGTPNSSLSIKQIVERVKEEASIYFRAKVDGIMVENMHDIPYIRERSISPEITASMTVACMAVNEVLGSRAGEFIRGVQVLAAANRHALAIAQACEFDFIRAECFTFSHIADEGPMSACAGELLRYRRHIGAERVAVITDIKKKHSSHAITSDLSVGDVAEASEFFQADGVIITGAATGCPANTADIREIRSRSTLPVFIGSGVTLQNMREYIAADGFIVGSHFKEGGHWQNRLDEKKVQLFMDAARLLQRNINSSTTV